MLQRWLLRLTSLVLWTCYEEDVRDKDQIQEGSRRSIADETAEEEIQAEGQKALEKIREIEAEADTLHLPDRLTQPVSHDPHRGSLTLTLILTLNRTGGLP